MKKAVLTLFLFTINQIASAMIHIHNPEKLKCRGSTFFQTISIDYEGLPVVYRDHVPFPEYVGGAVANCKGAIEVAQKMKACIILQTSYKPWQYEYFKVYKCPIGMESFYEQ